MKKVIIILEGLMVFPLFIYSQSFSSSLYSYKTRYYYESIDLHENGNFTYHNKTEFTEVEIKGNWQLRNDSILVLDSSPQRSKIIVFEFHKKSKKNTFRIRDMNSNHIQYNLFLITGKNDTLKLKNQYDKTVLSGEFSSFYIIDTKGQYSPVYEIKGTNSNFFDIMLEGQRVFDNEYWKFYGKYIVPLGLNGKYVNYTLRID